MGIEKLGLASFGENGGRGEGKNELPPVPFAALRLLTFQEMVFTGFVDPEN
jgi:hypothetical protein